jgi:hypothetical protein
MWDSIKWDSIKWDKEKISSMSPDKNKKIFFCILHQNNSGGTGQQLHYTIDYLNY